MSLKENMNIVSPAGNMQERTTTKIQRGAKNKIKRGYGRKK
jgi:hypothetical protein